MIDTVGGLTSNWDYRIYLGRQLFVWFYDRRITRSETALADLTSRRGDTIEKLKTATKFYSTQTLLEKYGGGSEMTEDDRRSAMSRKGSLAGFDGQQSLRMRNVNNLSQGSVRGKPPQMYLSSSGHQQPQAPQPQNPGQGAAPQQSTSSGEPLSLSPSQLQVQEQLRQQQNLRPLSLPGHPISSIISTQSSPTRTTFNIPAPPTAPAYAPPPGVIDSLEAETDNARSWYDRLLDILIGEDETSTKARYALICSNCRMVNGLAPPGTKSLSEVGRWGCGRCGTMNGKDIEVKRKKGPATVRKEGDVKEVKELIEREIAEEMLGKSVKKGSGRRRGSIKGWTKQIQELQAQQEGEEGEEEEEEEEGDEEEEEMQVLLEKNRGKDIDREGESQIESNDEVRDGEVQEVQEQRKGRKKVKEKR